jgi:signal transduction histidine kinase
MRAVRGPLPFRRAYLIALAVIAVLFVGSFALFARLLADQLSRSYLEDVLLSGKIQGEGVKRAIEGETSVYKAIATRKESLDKISAAFSRQHVVETIQVFDDRGRFVYGMTTSAEGIQGGFPTGGVEYLQPFSHEPIIESSHEYQILMPVQDMGTVVVRIPKSALTGRLDELRHRLLMSSAAAGGVGLLVLVAAALTIWILVQRNSHLEARRHLDEELAGLGRLAANLAHEIRNPLNALSINLELIEEDQSARAAPVDTVQLARREAGRLSRLVNDFLNYARPAAPVLADVDVSQLAREVSELMRPGCARQGVVLTVEAVPVKVKADHGQLHQVLVNLAQNACQAMEGSPVKELRFRTACADGEAVLEVADSGPGIPEAELERVREAFYSRRKGGTGLGLAIADRIVAGHGGRLELENLRRGGLVARVVLPLPSTAAV